MINSTKKEDSKPELLPSKMLNSQNEVSDENNYASESDEEDVKSYLKEILGKIDPSDKFRRVRNAINL